VEQESKTARKMAQVKERRGGGEERKEGNVCRQRPLDFENRPLSGPSFLSPSLFFQFLALVSFLARSKPKILFLGLFLL